MATAVASSATTTETVTSSLMITKPTGLAANDLLAAVIYDSGGIPSTPSGWTAVVSRNSGVRKMAIFGKIASSGDAAASNFFFPASTGTPTMSGILFRVTGNRTDTIDSITGSGSQTTATPAAFSISATPATVDSFCLLAFSFNGLNTSGAQNKDVTSPVITSNPTWTRQFVNGNGSATTGRMQAVFTAIRSSASTITSVDATYDSAGMLAGTSTDIIFADFGALIDATGTNALLAVSPTLFSENGVAGTTGTNALLAVSPTIPTQHGIGQILPIWTNPDKGTTTWTNPNK